MKDSGLIHIYCGSGKGKTTAAMGLAIRCSGGGGKVIVYQFLKDNTSGERNSLRQISNIKLIEGVEKIKFTFKMNETEKQELKAYYRNAFQEIQKLVNNETFHLLILDEILATISGGFLNENEVIAFLKRKPSHLEVVLTGRNPSETMMELADYISCIEKVKHPYEQGIGARKLIEY